MFPPTTTFHHSSCHIVVFNLFFFVLTTTVLLSSSNKRFFFASAADNASYPQQQQQHQQQTTNTNNIATAPAATAGNHPLLTRPSDYWRKGHSSSQNEDALSSSLSSSRSNQQREDNNDSEHVEDEEEGDDDGEEHESSSSSSWKEDFSLEDDDDDSPEEEEEDLLYYDWDEEEEEDREEQSSEAMIVCGVDGTVYTLDAWTGQLRGLFPSGNALVGSSMSMFHPNDKEEEEYEEDDLDHIHKKEKDPAAPSSFVAERIVPGLDGNLYSLTQIQTSTEANEQQSQNLPFSSPELNMLDIHIDDVLLSPVSTCRPSTTSSTDSYHQTKETCGIVMGQRTTKLFALNVRTGTVLNVRTGTVQWMQHAAGKDGGFSTHNLLHKKKKKQTSENQDDQVVLLQREDFVVRHVDVETGEETWKVQLGKFKALDFTNHQSSKPNSKDVAVSVSSQKPKQQKTPQSPSTPNTNNQADNHNHNNNCHPPPPNSIQSRIPNVPNKKNKKQAINHNNKRCHNGGTTKKIVSPHHAHHQDTAADGSMFVQPMPSIAFRMDGSSFVGLDSTTGDVLWKRKIDSIVASAYGVSSTGEWTPLHVIEDFDDPDQPLQPQDNDSSSSNTIVVENEEDSALTHHHDSTTMTTTSSSSSYPSLNVNPSSNNETPTILQIPLLSSSFSATTNTVTTTNNNNPNEITAGPNYYDPQKTNLDHTQSSPPLTIYNHQNDEIDNHLVQPQQQQTGADMIAKVGKHSSNFFVFSTIPKLVGTGSTKDDNKNNNDLNLFLFPQPNNDSPHFLEGQEPKIHHPNNNALLDGTISSSSLDSTYNNIYGNNPLALEQIIKKAGVDISDPKLVTAYLNHLALKNKTNIHEINGGLFLTWQMVAMLVSILVGMIFCGHGFYQKQKRKWISMNVSLV